MSAVLIISAYFDAETDLESELAATVHLHQRSCADWPAVQRTEMASLRLFVARPPAGWQAS